MKVSRNDPCPCGSGKKYKRCHLGSDEALGRAPGPRIVERNGEKFAVSPGLGEGDIDAAADYFEERERHGGPAQQMADFVQPLLDKTDGSKEQVERVFTMGMLCWNVAILPDAKRAEAISAAARNIVKTDDEREAFEDMIDFMVERHEEMFPWLHQRRAPRAG